MFPKSLRWRLPLSYAAIALITTLVLGVMLLLILQRFYRAQELDYLNSSAAVMSEELRPSLEAALPAGALEAQMRTLAFLSQARVRVFDPQEALIADSGLVTPGSGPDAVRTIIEVEETAVEGGENGQFSFSREESAAGVNYRSSIVLEDGLFSLTRDEEIIVNAGESFDTIEEEVDISRLLPPFGLGLNERPLGGTTRSTLTIKQSIQAADGALLGYVELSDGPAYGEEILTSVAWGWGIAAIIAVLIAAVTGWGISRQVNQPLLQLTDLTQQMAAGDLSVRASHKSETGSEIEQLAHAFNRMANQVEGTVLTLRQFVADAAHELNTPLTALKTNLELVAQREHLEDGTQLREAQAQVARLEQLTSGLLELSMLEGADAELEPPTAVNLTTLLNSLAERLASRAEHKEVSFELHLPAKSIWITGHPQQLYQLFYNLGDNALKFTQPGDTIWLSVQKAKDEIEIMLEDTGLGVDPQEIPLLFERFFRGRQTAAYPGSGLGLAIAYAVVQRHGGQISITPRNPGTRVTLRLPADTQPPERSE